MRPHAPLWVGVMHAVTIASQIKALDLQSLQERVKECGLQGHQQNDDVINALIAQHSQPGDRGRTCPIATFVPCSLTPNQVN
jgi:hypothetical protein